MPHIEELIYVKKWGDFISKIQSDLVLTLVIQGQIDEANKQTF